mgnify:CR=1 FL=1
MHQSRGRLCRLRLFLSCREFFEKLFLRVRYFPPPGDIPVRKAFPGGIAAHPNSEV